MVLIVALLVCAATSLGARQAPPIGRFLDAGGADSRVAEAALRDIAAAWRDGYTPMFIDMARLLTPRRVNGELVPHPSVSG